MGAGPSAAPDPVPESVEAAKAAGYTDEQIKAYQEKAEKAETVTTESSATTATASAGDGAANPAPVADPSATATCTVSSDSSAPAVATPAADATPSAETDTVDRDGIQRNSEGSEEPSSADPELWNVDGTEVDFLVKYKIGGQMWYVQSRMRENPPKGMPIPGFPINKKARDAKRFYKIEDDAGEEVLYNKDNEPSTHWKKAMQVPPKS